MNIKEVTMDWCQVRKHIIANSSFWYNKIFAMTSFKFDISYFFEIVFSDSLNIVQNIYWSVSSYYFNTTKNVTIIISSTANHELLS